jgi:hypothetical protein
MKERATQAEILARELRIIRDRVQTEQNRIGRIAQATEKLANAIQILARPEVSRTLKT